MRYNHDEALWPEPLIADDSTMETFMKTDQPQNGPEHCCPHCGYILTDSRSPHAPQCDTLTYGSQTCQTECKKSQRKVYLGFSLTLMAIVILGGVVSCVARYTYAMTQAWPPGESMYWNTGGHDNGYNFLVNYFPFAICVVANVTAFLYFRLCRKTENPVDAIRAETVTLIAMVIAAIVLSDLIISTIAYYD